MSVAQSLVAELSYGRSRISDVKLGLGVVVVSHYLLLRGLRRQGVRTFLIPLEAGRGHPEQGTMLG